jgi:hypothetical protein
MESKVRSWPDFFIQLQKNVNKREIGVTLHKLLKESGTSVNDKKKIIYLMKTEGLKTKGFSSHPDIELTPLNTSYQGLFLYDPS